MSFARPVKTNMLGAAPYNKATGRCYELAYVALVTEDEFANNGVLVHGILNGVTHLTPQ